MQDLFNNLLFPTQYIPHGHCYLWQPGLVWLHLLSDLLIALAYYSIPVLLIYFVRQRQDIPFRGVFLLFGIFIISCGTTHLVNIWTLWYPTYWVSGVIKAITAFVSCYTALELIPIIPQALAMPSPAKLEAANCALEREIVSRKQAEGEIRKLNAELEERVKQRTVQLVASNQEKEQLLQREQQARAVAESTRLESQIYAERLALALDAAQMGSWDWDLTTNRIFWNPQHEIILGYEPGQSERSYEDWVRCIYLEDLPNVEAALQASFADRSDYFCEYRAVLPDGQIRWLNTAGKLYCDANNRPIRMVGIVADITERKQTDAAVRESEERFRATFEQAAVGIAHVGLDGRWVRVNQRLCDIVGYTRDELLKLTFQDITHPDDLEKDLDYVQQLLAGEIDHFSLEKRYVCKKGSIVWTEITVSLLRERAGTFEDQVLNPQASDPAHLGQPKYFIGVVEEIGDRKQAEMALQKRAEELAWANRQWRRTTTLLRRRNEELDQFAYVVSHDLKAPLRAITNLSEWIEEDLDDRLNDENRHQMRLLRGRVTRMEALIDGLLEYSRVGRIEISVETMHIGALLSEVIDSLAPPASFQFEISPMPTIPVKRLLLRQVFANLISNAIKHHDRSDGRISVSVQEQEDYYEFAVSDDGPGIAPEHHSRIFGIFQTLTARDAKESTGIGLSIVKKIIEAEGGTIAVESQPGEGTTFRFTWLKQPKPEDARESA